MGARNRPRHAGGAHGINLGSHGKGLWQRHWTAIGKPLASHWDVIAKQTRDLYGQQGRQGQQGLYVHLVSKGEDVRDTCDQTRGRG